MENERVSSLICFEKEGKESLRRICDWRIKKEWLRYGEIGYQQNYRSGHGGHPSEQEPVGTAKKTDISVWLQNTKYKTHNNLACQKDGNFTAAIAEDAKQFEAPGHYTKLQYSSVLESRMMTA